MKAPILTVVILLCQSAVSAQQPSVDTSAQQPAIEAAAPKTCAACHNGKGDGIHPGPPYQLLKDSVHVDLDCTDCHESMSMDDVEPGADRPHGAADTSVDCGECHEDEAEVYQSHGRLQVGKDPDLPSCWSCHGTHEIRRSSDRQSHVHAINLPSTCRACHANVDLVKKHDILRDEPIALYDNSVHGRATRKGLYAAATCNDCHSASDSDGKRTAHRILSPADPESTTFHFNIPDTCGQCHKYLTRDYWDGIHGQYVKRGSTDAPVCTHCHGEHGIIARDDPDSPVSSAHVAEETCTPCHESAVLNKKYGLAGGRLASYVDSYHGLKSKAGDATVANCASCHGAHRILPSSDETSSIHAENLQVTCGECHPGITAELAQAKIHEPANGVRTGWPELVRKVYIALIVVTIGLMLLHNGADWIRRIRNSVVGSFVQRLGFREVAQHWALMISFMVLVISGFSLRFSEAGWVQFLFGWDGGFEVRGIIHRVAAVVMTAVGIWHMFYLTSKRGRKWCKDMMPARSDLQHLLENILWFVGKRTGEPRFKRFSYVEKAEYWALVWGSVIMTITGLMLWFDNYLIEAWSAPKVLLDIALVIHFYEAWLAFLAIVVWHIYDTVLKPSVYPMNPAWISGKMPRHMYAEEHPEGPRLKARTLTMRYEDDDDLENGQPATVSGGSDSGTTGPTGRDAPRSAHNDERVAEDAERP